MDKSEYHMSLEEIAILQLSEELCKVKDRVDSLEFAIKALVKEIKSPTTGLKPMVGPAPQ